MRAPTLLALESRAGLTLRAPDGSVRLLPDDSGALGSAVLAFCAAEPRSRADIERHVEALSGAPLGDAAVLEQLVAVLRDAGALVPFRPAVTSSRRSHRGPGAETPARVVLAVCGAVAAAHAPTLVLALQAQEHDVRVLATRAALRFVSRAALEALTHRPVLASMWPRRAKARDAEPPPRVPHVEVAAWADAMVVWPATAATLGRIASGDTSELVSAVALTTRAPVLVAPSMNPAMLEAPAIERNLETLRADGFHLLPPALAFEVADAPEARTPLLGGAPPPEVVAQMLEVLLRTQRRLEPAVPHDAVGWDRLHRLVPEAEQAWFTTELDADVARALEAHAPASALVWDVGTGHGATAIWAARRGHAVVATDVSRTALARARARAGTLRITFLEDDVTRTALEASFDVVVDRGTLHSLPVAARAAYAESVLRCTRPGSVLLVKAHAPGGDARVLCHPISPEELVALFGDRMELAGKEPGVFQGTLTPPPAAVTTVLRRCS